MTSPSGTIWSATEPMPLSLNAQMADLSPSPAKRIPSAAQRYYTQPRVGSSSGPAVPPTHHTRVEVTTDAVLIKEKRLLDAENEQKIAGKGEETPKKRSKMRKRQKSFSISPSRHSPRLIKQKTAALGRMIQERFVGDFPPASTKAHKTPRRHSVDSISGALPALSEDPASYKSDMKDCRFHLPTTVEDRLAIRAALTPTLFRLKKKGWDVSVVWNPDASYMEAHQKCLQEYYRFELTKKPDLSPFSLPVALTLLPWYGKISDFRNSPNWPEGW